jgi:hypothetical protein
LASQCFSLFLFYSPSSPSVFRSSQPLLSCLSLIWL